jgi:DNA-binding CsgD family transcriptional regulator
VSFERQPCGVSRFASQAKPRELSNRRTRQRVTAIVHDQRTNPSFLPVMERFGRRSRVSCISWGGRSLYRVRCWVCHDLGRGCCQLVCCVFCRGRAASSRSLYRVGRSRGRRLGRRPLVLPGVRPVSEPWVEVGLPAALADLSERQRVSVLLVHSLGWSQSEVGRLLGVSQGAVHTHLERGLKRLRSKLGVSDV